MKNEMKRRMIELLNEAHIRDPKAIEALVEHRVPCNSDLTYHPSIVVQARREVGEANTVGLLGILNGILDLPLGQRIRAIYSREDDGTAHLMGFGGIC